jgi:G3E family GTPase
VTLLPGCRLDGTVVLADAETVRARAADRYVGDTIARQLAGADLVVLNKTDLVPPREFDTLVPWIHERAPHAGLVCAQRAQVPREVVLGIATAYSESASGGWMRSGRIGSVSAAPPTARFETAIYRPADSLDLSSLGHALSDPALGVLRAKGRLRDADGAWKTLHVMGSRSEVSPAPASSGGAALVCIGLAGTLDQAAIESAVSRAMNRAQRA